MPMFSKNSITQMEVSINKPTLHIKSKRFLVDVGVFLLQCRAFYVGLSRTLSCLLLLQANLSWPRVEFLFFCLKVQISFYTKEKNLRQTISFNRKFICNHGTDMLSCSWSSTDSCCNLLEWWSKRVLVKVIATLRPSRSSDQLSQMISWGHTCST